MARRSEDGGFGRINRPFLGKVGSSIDVWVDGEWDRRRVGEE